MPERIAPSQAVASANPVFLSAPTQQVQRAIDLREQAAIAKEKLPPGRRIYVDLSVSRDVSWRQVRAPPPTLPRVTLTGACTVVLRMAVACDILSVGRGSAGCVRSS